MEIVATSKGVKESEKILNGIITNLDEIQHELLLKIATDTVYEAKSNLQNNTNINSGTLLADIGIKSDTGKSIILGSEKEYAGYVEFGRGVVKPKDPDGYLHWIDKDTGKDVFAKSAGPSEPNPFLQPAVTKISSNFSDMVAKRILSEVEK